jgi:putative membrane protein
MKSHAQRSGDISTLVAATLSPPLFGALPAAAQQSPYFGPGWGGGWWMMFGPFTMVLFIALTVVVVVLLLRWLGGQGAADRPLPTKSAIDILRERFARGEIDKQEFEDKRRILGG